MVFQDGQAFIDDRGDIRCQNVLDNLIFRREIPPMIAVFINPGRTPEQTEPSPAVGWGDGFTNRRIEYNTPEGGYSRVVCDELLPVIEAEYNISSDPKMRGIGGSSSGAIAAFMVAWERPEAFHKVLSNVGSFTDIEGGHVYPDLVRAEPVTKPIRIFLCDGRNDNRSLSADGSYNEKRDWFYQNVRMQSALEDKGYDLNYTWGVNLHGQKFGGHAMPEMMRWLWRDCTPVVTDPRDLASRSFLMPLAPKEGPTWGTTGYASYPELIADLDTRGYTPIVLGTAIDGSHIVAVKAGGTKLPPIFLSAGAHSTEQAGVCAAVDLLDELQCDHELWVLPCRDPIGLTGYRHALHLGLPFELEPAVDTMEGVAELLRQRGTVLVDEPDTPDQLLVALLGEFGYALYLDGRSSSMLPPDFASSYPEAAAALVGRRLWWPSNSDDVPGASTLERAYTQFGGTDQANEVLHLNRFHDTAWCPVEVRCCRELMAAIKPGLVMDLHEHEGDDYWMSARHQKTGEGEAWEIKIAAAVAGAVSATGTALHGGDEGYAASAHFDLLGPGVFWLNADVRGEGLNLADYGADQNSLAFSVETGMKNPMADRVAMQKLTVQTAVNIFEQRYA